MPVPRSVEPRPAHRPAPSRRALMRGAAWSVPVAAAAVSAPALAVSATCLPEGTLFDAQSRGMLVSGGIAGIDLDTIAEVNGVHAQAFDPAAPGADGTVSDTDANPLSVTALSALTIDLGGVAGTLSSILDLVAGQDAGVVGQYAYANEAVGGTNTAEIGSSGAVGDDGAVTLDTSSANPPALGHINLYSLLQNATGLSGVSALVASISDLTLDVGAAAGIAEMDSLCVAPTLATASADEVQRDYLLAYLRLLVESDTVGGLLSGLTDALDGGLDVSTSAVWDILEGVPLLGSLLAALGESALEVTATVDLTQLTGSPLPDEENAALQLDLGEGTILIDLASLLGGAYTGDISTWLNELAPNTRLFVDAGLPNDAVTSLLDTWVDSLVERLKDLITVTVRAGSVTGLGATGLLIQGSLRQFLEGGATATFVLLGIPVNLGALLNPLLASIGGVVQGTLDTLLNDNAVVNTALDAVGSVLTALFTVLEGVLRITVNAQNASSGVEPAAYSSISPDGRYDVAALHIELLGALNLLNLSLARGSVGENLPRL
ncbi:choice-of-anchor G family protein [Brachybacterium sp. NBEC-018]|uniref:choice-of-anchor G family protein n=1 Tax=Brachybacterium sp. NBEC-018 TaxID=2996004 RepID=UPI0021754583|nr:choice-of-anchor G family protein [Brachybacterium sp. NBEC-018]UVY84850.1 choice-of-anchor G family protein [Brachybacterium sp. NBEC-018]